MAMRWYVLHVYSGFEKKVAEAIRDQARQKGMEEMFEEILVPTEEVVELRRGQKVNAERKFFPGLCHDPDGYDRRELAPGEKHAEGHGLSGQPQTGADFQQGSRAHPAAGPGRCGAPEALRHFEIGEQVRVSDGPFTSFNGLVEDVDEERARAQGRGVDLWPLNTGGIGVFASREALTERFRTKGAGQRRGQTVREAGCLNQVQGWGRTAQPKVPKQRNAAAGTEKGKTWQRKLQAISSWRSRPGRRIPRRRSVRRWVSGASTSWSSARPSTRPRRTSSPGTPTPVVITAFSDRSFSFRNQDGPGKLLSAEGRQGFQGLFGAEPGTRSAG